MEFKNVKINSIVVKKQVRTLFNEESLKSLSESIAEKGVLQPILVKKLSDDDYVIIAGERRFLASQLTGLEEIPALVIDNSDDITEIQLIENIQREDLNPVDLANSFKKLRDEGKTLDYITKLTGKSSSYIKEILTILNLSEDEKEKIKSGEAYTNFTRKKTAEPDIKDSGPISQKNTDNSDLANKNNDLNNNYMTENTATVWPLPENHIDTPENQEPQGIDGENVTESNIAVIPTELKSEDQNPGTPDAKIQNQTAEIPQDPYEAVAAEEVFKTETDYPDYSGLPKTENTDEAGNLDKVFVEQESLVNEEGNTVDLKSRPVYDTEDEGNKVIITPEDLKDLMEKFNSEDFGFKIKILKNKSLQITDITTIKAHGILVCLINNVKGYL